MFRDNGEGKSTKIEESKKHKLIPLKCEAAHNMPASWFLDFEDGTKPIPLCETHGKTIQEQVMQKLELRDKCVKADSDLKVANNIIEQLKKDAICYEEEIDRLEQRVDEQNCKTKNLEEEIKSLRQSLKRQIRRENRRQARMKEILQESKIAAK